MDMLLNFTFKSALDFSTLAIKPFNSSTFKVVLSCNCYCNAMNQSSLKRLNCHPNDTPIIKSNVCTACIMPFLLYQRLIQPYISLFGCYWECNLLLRPQPCIILIARTILHLASNVQRTRCPLLQY